MKQAIIKSKKFNILSTFINCYIKYKIYSNFDNAWDRRPKRKIIVSNINLVSDKLINRSIQLLKKSKKPIMIIGNQIMQYKDSIQDIIQYLKNLSIPFYLTSSARGLMGKNNEYQITH